MYELDEVLRDMIAIARQAGGHALMRRPEVLASTRAVREKASDRQAEGQGRLIDVTVTDVDCESQQIVLSELHRRYPDATCMVEECTKANARHPIQATMYAREDSAHAFAVDPLDGTANYAQAGLGAHPNHRDDWAVCIGYLFEQRMQVAVMWFPVTRELLWAVRDGGAWEDVDGRTRSLRLEAHVPWVGPLSLRHWQSLAELGFESELPYTTLTCTARELASIARGRGGQFVGAGRTKVIDAGVGRLVVEEAGGASSDLKGRPVKTDPQDADQASGERLALYREGLIVAASLAEVDAVVELIRSAAKS